MELCFGTLIKVNDPSQNAKNLTAIVIAHDLYSNKVLYRIVTDNYIGIATHKTNRWNCTVIGKYNGHIDLKL